MIPLRSLRLQRTTPLRAIVLATLAALATLATPSHARAQKALVYCPIGIDVTGCTNLVAALQTVFPSGVDRGYDGSSGTVDLRSANLWGYSLIAIPSLATTGGATPYAVLSDTAMGSRLHDAMLGRIALWSGTPDLGSPNGTQKDTLIQNLAKWAGANYGAVKGPGLVVFQDMSDSIATQYGWLHLITGAAIAGDSTVSTHATVQGVTPTGTALLRDPTGNAIAYANMAAFGFLAPATSSGFTVDGISVTATGMQNVLLTSLGGNSGGATIATDADDYAPGTIVTLTGSGFAPGEKVTVSLRERPFLDTPATITATADKTGAFVDKSFSPDSADINVRFIATAVGQSSGLRAATTFTDAAPSTVTVAAQTPTQVLSGSDATFVVTVGIGGNSGSCTASLSAAPTSSPAWPTSGVTFTFNPASVTGQNGSAPTSTLTVHTPSGMAPNTYHFGITAAGQCQGSGNGTQQALGNSSLVVVSPIVSASTAVSSSASTSVFGQSVTFTATVTPASGTSAPTGTIQFLDNGSILGAAVPLAAGTASVSTATLGAGSHTISATYTPGSGFAAGSVSSVTQTVNKATPSLAWGTPTSIPYGTALSTAQLNAVATPSAGTLTYTPAAGAVLTAGAQTLSVTFTPTDGTDYNPGSMSVVLTVTQLSATVSANDQTRAFGQSNPTLTGTVAGFLPADNISATYTTTATPTSNIGPYAITPTIVDPNGRLGNYAVMPTSGTLTITPAAQSITFTAPTGLHYGDADAALGATATSAGAVSYVSSTQAVCTIAGTSVHIVAAGSCSITAQQPGGGNYLAATDVTQSFAIAQRAIGVSANALSKTYNAPDPTLTYGVTSGSLVGSDAFTGTLSRAPGETAGTYTIGQGTLTAGPNYALSFIGSTFTINKADQTISFGQPTDPTYGDSPLTLSATASSGLAVSFSATGTCSASGNTLSVNGAGTCLVTASQTGDQNRNPAPDVAYTLTIKKAPLGVQAGDASRVYGDVNPTFTGTLSGVVNNDNITASYSSTADAASAVGAATITAALLDPNGRLGNYTVTNTSGKLTITPAPLVIAAANATRVYGGANPAFAGTITGIKNGDAIAASYSSTATPQDNVGSYAIVPAAVDPSPSKIGNYTVTLMNGTLSITPAPLAVTTNASTKVYGDQNPAFSVGYAGFVNNESSSALGGTLAFATAANPTTGVGNVAVTPSGLTSTNYNITFAAGQLTITQAPLAITAANATRVFGAPDPVFTGTITGIKNNDGITATYTTSAKTLSDVGAYDITPAAVDAAPPRLANYAVTLTKGTFTITKATAIIMWQQPASIPQGNALSWTQLNATSSGVGGAAVAGSFAYVPPAGTVLYAAASTPLSTTFTSADGNYFGATGATQVQVTNVAPTVTSVVLGAAPIAVNSPASISAAFTDPGLTDTHSATIDWGDGSSGAGSVVTDVSLSMPTGAVSGSHTYTAAGVYTVTVTVTDMNGGIGSRSSAQETIGYIVVYDPSAGFVTGGGWIASPAGACRLASCTATTTGKANFGFNARYQKGANIPDGSTEFQFQAGGLNFKSTVYSWLVVSGTRAQYKGSGTINGVAGYGFLLTAIDGDPKGSPDAFRMKITDSGGNVVYDNQMGADDTGNASTVLGGGSIVIHQ